MVLSPHIPSSYTEAELFYGKIFLGLVSKHTEQKMQILLGKLTATDEPGLQALKRAGGTSHLEDTMFQMVGVTAEKSLLLDPTGQNLLIDGAHSMSLLQAWMGQASSSWVRRFLRYPQPMPCRTLFKITTILNWGMTIHAGRRGILWALFSSGDLTLKKNDKIE